MWSLTIWVGLIIGSLPLRSFGHSRLQTAEIYMCTVLQIPGYMRWTDVMQACCVLSYLRKLALHKVTQGHVTVRSCITGKNDLSWMINDNSGKTNVSNHQDLEGFNSVWKTRAGYRKSNNVDRHLWEQIHGNNRLSHSIDEWIEWFETFSIMPTLRHRSGLANHRPSCPNITQCCSEYRRKVIAVRCFVTSCS